MKRFIKTGQRGDTIVEVLIAVAVIGFILSVSYAVANRSTQNVRKAHERSEALKFSEAQLEKLKLHLGRGNTWQNNAVCILDDDSVSTDANQCRIGDGNRYALSIDEPSPNLYNITTTWEKVGGGTNEVLSMFYRIHDKDDSPDFTCDGAGCEDDDDAGGGGATDPDTDGDGIPDSVDECDDVFADTSDGCPPPDRVLTIAKSVSGGGTVSGNGINCGSTCTKTVSDGTSINISSLSVTAAANYVFTGWSPSQCNGTITLTANMTCTANFTHVPRVPLYRCYNTSNTDHYYTVQSWLCYNGISAVYPWIYYEGVVGYVPTGGPYSSSYVYGGYHAGIGDSFYTTNYNEYVSAHYAGWSGSSGYQGWSLYPNCSVPGTVPLYRKNHSGVGDHFYTTNYGEAPHYQYEGIQGCLFANP